MICNEECKNINELFFHRITLSILDLSVIVETGKGSRFRVLVWGWAPNHSKSIWVNRVFSNIYKQCTFALWALKQ